MDTVRTTWMATIISAIVAGAITAGATATYQHYQQVKTTNDLQAQINTLKQQLAVTPTASPTASWLSYSDTKQGFTIKYPATGWKVTSSATNTTLIESTATIPDQALPYDISVTSTSTTKSIPDYLASQRQTLAATAAQGGPNVTLKSESVATINGLAAYTISDQKVGPDGCTADQYFFRNTAGTTIYTLDVITSLCQGTSYDISDNISIGTQIAKTFGLL